MRMSWPVALATAWQNEVEDQAAKAPVTPQPLTAAGAAAEAEAAGSLPN